MILVTGATGYTGRLLVNRLVANGEQLRLLVRSSSSLENLKLSGVETVTGELRTGVEKELGTGVNIAIHLAGMEHVGAVIKALDGAAEQVVVTSSLRLLSHVPSATTAKVAEGERELAASGVPSTLLRPSMIFGPGNDRNICRLADQLRRIRVRPVFGSGRHLMQPVYVEDLVSSIVACMGNRQTIGKVYAIAGGRALSYNEIIDAVGEAVGVVPFKVHLPVRPALALMRCAEKVRLTLPVSVEQVGRLQEDKSYSIEEARRDFGYDPLDFQSAINQIYSPPSNDGE